MRSFHFVRVVPGAKLVRFVRNLGDGAGLLLGCSDPGRGANGCNYQLIERT